MTEQRDAGRDATDAAATFARLMDRDLGRTYRLAAEVTLGVLP